MQMWIIKIFDRESDISVIQMIAYLFIYLSLTNAIWCKIYEEMPFLFGKFYKYNYKYNY